MSNPTIIPTNHDRRKVIMVLSKQDINNLRTEDDDGLRSNPNVCLIDYDSLVTNYGILESMRPVLAPNIVLIQSPYNTDLYEIGADAMYKFSVSKHVIVTQIFRLLGCRKLQVVQLDFEGTKVSRQLKIVAEHPELTAEFQRLSYNEKNLYSEVKLDEVYDGYKPKIQQAYDYLKKHYLANDSNLKGLIEKRSDEDNKMQEYNFEVSLTQETKHTLEFLGKVSIPQFLVKLQANISSTTENKTQYKVTYHAEF